MNDKKKYYKLDDIGFVGTQVKMTHSLQNYHSRKTGEVFRAARLAADLSRNELKKELKP